MGIDGDTLGLDAAAVKQLRAENEMLREVHHLAPAKSALLAQHRDLLCKLHKLGITAGSGGHAQQLE